MTSGRRVAALALVFPVPTERAELSYIALCRTWSVAEHNEAIDFNALEAALRQTARCYSLARLNYDPWSCETLVSRLEGVPRFRFAQNRSGYDAPTRAFMADVQNKRVWHTGDPLLRASVSGCVLSERANKVMPDLTRSFPGATPVAALIMAVAGLIATE